MTGVSAHHPEAAVSEHPTVADSWQPRSEAWLQRAPSEFAGLANRPLFIAACPRSGTTLLRAMLNNHPDLAIPPETDFLIPAWRARPRYGDLRRPENRRKLAEFIFDTPGRGGRHLRGGAFGREQAIERVVAAPPTLGSAFAACFEMFAEAHGKPRWGDKRPRYTGFIEAIFKLFPHAQFINVIRDPRAAVASQISVGWYSEEMRLAQTTAAWETAIERVDKFAPELRRDQLLDVRYEDMVRHPRATLERICEFAGLRDGDAVDHMLTGARSRKYNEGSHARVEEEISTAPIDGWRSSLEPHEVALVEYATRTHFERLGYKPDPDLDTAPKPADLAELKARHRGRRRKWRKYALGEVKRRYITYRHPVAAVLSRDSNAG